MSNNIKIDSFLKNESIKKTENDLENKINPLDLQKNFLSLLVAQMKNQDPTDPIKNSDLTSQLAQINTASGIEKLNNNVGQFSTQIKNNQNIQLSSLIGHHVIVPSNKIIRTQNEATKFGIELNSNATLVKIEITDSKNKVVFSQEIKNLESGRYTFLWDGKNLKNEMVKSGKYNIVVTAKNQDQNIPVKSLSEAVINAIITSALGPIVDLGAAGQVMSTDIREILT